MTVDHQRTLGNYGAKHRVTHEGKDYIFDFPGPSVYSEMEQVVKKKAREILEESKSYLTPEDYSIESREFKRRTENGYFKAPGGEGFKLHFNLEQITVDTAVDVCLCLLRPNHKDITSAEVITLISEEQGHVAHVLTQIFAAAAAEAERQQKKSLEAKGQQ